MVSCNTQGTNRRTFSVSHDAWFTVGFLMSTTRKSKDNDARPVPQIQKNNRTKEIASSRYFSWCKR